MHQIEHEGLYKTATIDDIAQKNAFPLNESSKLDEYDATAIWTLDRETR